MFTLEPFNRLVIRTPLMPIEILKDDLDVGDVFNYSKDSLIREAFYLASQDLYNEILKISSEEELKDKKKVFNSFLKYLTRLSSRCTPFGLFSGCSIGYLGKNDSVQRIINGEIRHTTLDNLLLNELIVDYNMHHKDDIVYFPNNTIYELGDQLRYIEVISKGTSSRHVLSGVESEEIIKNIIEFSRKGQTLNELILYVISLDSDFKNEEVKVFLENLIDNQILVSFISPVIVGKTNTLDLFINRVNNREYKNFLLSLKEGLKTIDYNLKHNKQIKQYEDMKNLVFSRLSDFTKNNYVFQSDLMFCLSENTVNYDYYKDDLLAALSILNRLSRNYISKNLKEFKERFYNRYENQKMPLSIVLDTELGIEYGVGDYSISEFVDDLKMYIGSNTLANTNKTLTKEELFILNKIFKSKSKRLEITIEDLTEFEEDWNNVPDTFSCMISFYEDFISLSNVGGTSASNLLGRFGYLGEEFSSLIDEIFEIESEDRAKIIAEIIHLPESRTGNILYRYNTREYEIPYLGISSKDNSEQIPVEDILVYIENNTIKLRSKLLDKEIVPQLSNAHNYSLPSSVPIYQFLCDLQSQNKKVFLGVNTDSILLLLGHIPRISYKSIILIEEQWILSKQEIVSIKDELSLNKVLNEREINSNFYLVEGDNTLLIKVGNSLSANLFIDTIKGRNSVVLKEALHEFSRSIIKDQDSNTYSNEVIMSFYKKRK